jgi:hypothetical protein
LDSLIRHSGCAVQAQTWNPAGLIEIPVRALRARFGMTKEALLPDEHFYVSGATVGISEHQRSPASCSPVIETRGTVMKLTTIALAGALALSSTLAFAQSSGTSAGGSTAGATGSTGSSTSGTGGTVGQGTGPSTTGTTSPNGNTTNPAMNPSGNTLAPNASPSGSTLAPTGPGSGLNR